MAIDIKQIAEQVEEKSEFVRSLMTELEKVIVGQSYMLERLLVGLLSNGHILIEGVPGLAKTLTVTTMAQAIRASFQRLQFT
ncbi:MAG: AAA family ATPase, partial [Sedimentisphaerales bacterium]|nr:AAA family ATPase [Sedimentisphaerales bacterium]